MSGVACHEIEILRKHEAQNLKSSLRICAGSIGMSELPKIGWKVKRRRLRFFGMRQQCRDSRYLESVQFCEFVNTLTHVE
jgi:hypothetical protein